MRRVLDFVNENKKIIVVVVLIIILVGTIYFIGGLGKEESSGVSATTDKSATELKLTSILSAIDGVGATEVMINETNEQITGVIIVCEGADRIMVRNDILNAVSTALNIEKSIIAIYAMKV